MKQIIYIILPLLLLCSCSSKNKVPQKTICVSALVDLTDHRQLYPNWSGILPLFNLSIDENSEAQFRLCTITDRELNPDIEINLPGGIESEKDNSEDDPDYRKKLITQFFGSIRKAINDFNFKNEHDSSLGFSECFKTISGQLQYLTQKKQDKAVLLIFSDLKENSAIFNCYTEAGRKHLITDSENVIRLFEKTKLLPDNLNNISVFFIYNPISREDDIEFMAMVKVYKKLLQARGAKVKVQADNINLN